MTCRSKIAKIVRSKIAKIVPIVNPTGRQLGMMRQLYMNDNLSDGKLLSLDNKSILE